MKYGVRPFAALARPRELAVPHVQARIKESFIEVDYGDLEGEPLSIVSAEQWEAFETDHELALGNGESLASVDARVHAELDALLADQQSAASGARAPRDRESRLHLQGPPPSGARGAWLSRLAHAAGQRLDHHDRDASFRTRTRALQHGASASLISAGPRKARRSAVPAQECEGVEQLVIAKDARRQLGSFGTVEDGAHRVGESARDHQRKHAVPPPR